MAASQLEHDRNGLQNENRVNWRITPLAERPPKKKKTADNLSHSRKAKANHKGKLGHPRGNREWFYDVSSPTQVKDLIGSLIAR